MTSIEIALLHANLPELHDGEMTALGEEFGREVKKAFPDTYVGVRVVYGRTIDYGEKYLPFLAVCRGWDSEDSEIVADEIEWIFSKIACRGNWADI